MGALGCATGKAYSGYTFKNNQQLKIECMTLSFATDVDDLTLNPYRKKVYNENVQ